MFKLNFEQFDFLLTFLKEDELLNELVEFDDEIYDSTNYEQNRKLNEVCFIYFNEFINK